MIMLILIAAALPAFAAEETAPSATPPGASSPPPAAPAEEKPTLDFTTYGLTKYVWRGYENTKNSIVVQPSMTVGYAGFSANIWGKPGHEALLVNGLNLFECVDGESETTRLHIIRPSA